MPNEFIIKNGFISKGNSSVEGLFTPTSISASTYLNLPFTNFSGGTVTGNTVFSQGLTATTISATTYQNLPLSATTYVTGGTYSAGTITFTNTSGGTFDVIGLYTGETGSVTSLNSYLGGITLNNSTGNIVIENALPDQIVTLSEGSNISITGTYPNFTIDVTGSTTGATTVIGDYLPLSGGTVTGDTLFTQGLTANTISATLYENLPDYVTGNYLPLSGGTVTGDTLFTQGLTANTISATLYENLPLGIYGTGLTFNLANYDLSIDGGNGTLDTVSLSILSSDLTVTGGTYNPNNGVVTLTNNTGGTFNISGFTTGYTDFYVTGFTYSANTFYVKNTNTTYEASINTVTGLTSTGTISSNILSATTYQNLPNSLDGLYLRTSGGTVTGNTIFTQNISVTGGTGINWFSGNTSTDLLRVTQAGTGNALVIEDSGNPDTSPFVVSPTGNVGIGTTTPIFPLDIISNDVRISGSSRAGSLRLQWTANNTLVFNHTGIGPLFTAGPFNAVTFGDQSLQALKRGGVFASDQPNVPYGLVTGNLPLMLSSSTPDLVSIRMSPTINNNPLYTGITRGLHYIPTVISLGSRNIHRAIETTDGDLLFSNTSLTAITRTGGINIISGNTSTDLLRVTQTGTGNAFVVEDDTNPDSSPFVITSGGSVGIGTPTPSAKLQVSGNTLINGSLTATTTQTNSLIIQNPYVPTGSTDPTGTVGTISWSGNTIYLRNSTGWVRFTGETSW
jgi:hypothetical protein